MLKRHEHNWHGLLKRSQHQGCSDARATGATAGTPRARRRQSPEPPSFLFTAGLLFVYDQRRQFVEAFIDWPIRLCGGVRLGACRSGRGGEKLRQSCCDAHRKVSIQNLPGCWRGDQMKGVCTVAGSPNRDKQQPTTQDRVYIGLTLTLTSAGDSSALSGYSRHLPVTRRDIRSMPG
jgi:hypothetical protein